MSDTKAKELGLTPRARIITAATYGNEPEYMVAAQVIPIMDECGIEESKLNTHGGAIALGHPFGMTGARIMGTLLNVMETDDHQVGLETMCVAGGQGKAMLVERMG
jgi:acetyl-CoA C-acetyltransferase